MTTINREELRKHVIGPFKDLDEMKQVWERLREIGEETISSSFNYTEKFVLQRGLSYQSSGWGFASTRDEHTISPQDFLAKYGAETNPKTIADVLYRADELDESIPDYVRRYLLGNMSASISYTGSEVSLGEGDYANLTTHRSAIDWLVHQFGGVVKWT